MLECTGTSTTYFCFYFSYFRFHHPCPIEHELFPYFEMDLFHIRTPIFGFLILMIRASLAYPLNTSSQSTTLASPTLTSLISPEYLGDGYPVYPIVCIAPRGALPSPSEIPKILSDCSWIINEILLRKYDILFQDLVFRYNDYLDHFGQRHHSFWDHGKCAITVTSGSRDQTQVLQLFNVVLAANKILKDCILDQQVAQGGITRIGSFDKLFYVNVQGWFRYGTVN